MEMKRKLRPLALLFVFTTAVAVLPCGIASAYYSDVVPFFVAGMGALVGIAGSMVAIAGDRQ